MPRKVNEPVDPTPTPVIKHSSTLTPPATHVSTGLHCAWL